MDADILRKQLRKSLVTTKRLEAVDLDESLSESGSEAGSASPYARAGSYQHQQRQGSPDSVSGGLRDITEGVALGADSDLESDPKDGDDRSLRSHTSSGSGNRHGNGATKLGLDEQAAAEDEDGHYFHHVAGNDSSGESDTGSDAGGSNVNHVSVLEAWSKQIEQSAGDLRRRGSDNDFFGGSFSPGGGMRIEYKESQAHRAAPSPLQSPPAHQELEGFEPGAKNREALENLGKIFLRVKVEACQWLERILDEPDLLLDQEPQNAGTNAERPRRDPTETATLFEILRSGVVLCRVANTLFPGCITSFTSDFASESSFMIPLSERENIKKFVRACRDAMGIPDTLLFQVGDLHNMQNMPKVVLSLRAVAEYARINRITPPALHWPRVEDPTLGLLDDDDAVLLASSEMSKMDQQTVADLYAVETNPHKILGAAPPKDIENAKFQVRKRTIQQNLAMSGLSKAANPPAPPKVFTKSASARFQSLPAHHANENDAEGFGDGGDDLPQPPRSRSSSHPDRQFAPTSGAPASVVLTAGQGLQSSATTPTGSVAGDADDRLAAMYAAGELSVQAWLESLGMASYYHSFLEEGWDEMETVCLMTEADLRDVGITKKGHMRKVVNAMRKLKGLGGADDPHMPAAGQTAPASNHHHNRAHSDAPAYGEVEEKTHGLGARAAGLRGSFGASTRRYSIEKREIFNKDLSWSQCRARANVTQDLEDAKAIWAMLGDLKSRLSIANTLEPLGPDTARSIRHLAAMTEDIVRSLIPFDAPIIIDLGWNSIKCGFAFNKSPIALPTVVGKYMMNPGGPTTSASGLIGSGGGGSFRAVGTTMSPDSPASAALLADGRRHSHAHVFTAGRHVPEQCHAALAHGAAGLTTASEIGTFVVRRSIHRGIDSIKDPVVIEWDDMERLLEHVYRDVLHTYSDQHPVMVVEPAKGWSPADRLRMAQLLSDTFKVPAMHFTPAAPMVAFQADLKNCVVLDLGESRSTASVVYNSRLVRDAVVHSPIGGLQLTELMMQSLTQDGYEFKSIFEAKNPSKFASLRHYMEQEIAAEVKQQVCMVSPTFEEKVVNADALPTYLIDYLPRVTRGPRYINIGEARVKVPEALFSPEVIRRDQFYNGGSLQHIVKEALTRCTDVVANAASEIVVLCGGVANIPGVAERLQAELDELFAHNASKTPRVVLASPTQVELPTASDAPAKRLGRSGSSASRGPPPGAGSGSAQDIPDDPALVAWVGARRVVMHADFQTRWIPKQSMDERGEKALHEAAVSDGLGPFPLHSPDTALYKANRAVSALADVLALLHQFGTDRQRAARAREVRTKRSASAGSSSSASTLPSVGGRTSSGSGTAVSAALTRRAASRSPSPLSNRSVSRPDPVQTDGAAARAIAARAAGSPPSRSSHASFLSPAPSTPQSLTAQRVADLDADPLSPRSLKDLIQDVAAFLEGKGCPEGHILDVKMYLYELYANRPPQRKMGAVETVGTLPDRLLAVLTPYIDGRLPRPSSRGSNSGASAALGPPQPPVVDNFRARGKLLFADDEDEDEDEESAYGSGRPGKRHPKAPSPRGSPRASREVARQASSLATSPRASPRRGARATLDNEDEEEGDTVEDADDDDEESEVWAMAI